MQHRNILTYDVESPRDFTELQRHIAERLKAGITKREHLAATTLLPSAEQTGGLTPHEIAVLVVLMENRTYPTIHTGGHDVVQALEQVGYRRVAATLALESLMRKKMVDLEDYPKSFQE